MKFTNLVGKPIDETSQIIINMVRSGELTATSSYNGRPGCMCGCRGNHSDKPSAAVRRLAIIEDSIKAGDYRELDWDATGGYICATIYDRVTCVYFDGGMPEGPSA